MPYSAADTDRSPARRVAVAVLAVAIGVVLVWPMLRLGVEVIGAGGRAFGAALTAEGLEAITNSLWVSACVTALALAGGIGLALLVERTRFAARTVLLAGIAAPIAIPDFVTALGWTRAYGPGGLLDRAVGFELPGLYGPVGIVLVLTAGAVPLAFLLLVAGMRARGEADMWRAARISGASPVTAFRTVSLPLLLPVATAAGGLVFAMTMNAFGTPAVLGRPAGFLTMTTRIYQDLAFSSSDLAFERMVGLSMLLVGLVVIGLAVADRGVPPAADVGASTGQLGPRPPAPLVPLVAAWAFVALTVLVPLVALLLQALTRAAGLPPLPEHLTLDNFARAVDSRTLPAVGNSLLLAGAAALVCVCLALLAAVGPRAGGRRLAHAAIGTGFAVPGSVLAIAVLLAFGGALRDSLALIGVAYVAKLWALADRPIGASMDRLSASALVAARVHGADWRTAMRTIAVPLLAPVLLATGVLVFVIALSEVTISILLYGPGSATLAVTILNLQQLGDPTVTTALAVLLTVLVGVCLAPLALLRSRLPAGGGR